MALLILNDEIRSAPFWVFFGLGGQAESLHCPTLKDG